ncbi:MAG: HAD family phosphatase [Chthoniobacterales bacterium]|nr:HAD family phosphatase [Chthoniobacterales bacterium]
MPGKIRLLSTDFDGTLVAHHLNQEGTRDSVLDARCMALIQELQNGGAIWAINTGRSMSLLETGLTDFDFPVRPDFILTSERDVFRRGLNGDKWEAFGDWNSRVARDHAELYQSASAVYTKVLDYVQRNTRARIIHERHGPEGLIAQNEEEMAQIIRFIDEARAAHPKFHYQHNTVYLRFCHADYHKGAALAELSRLIEVPREETFAAGDHHNDISMLDGTHAAYPACPANAIPQVKQTVRDAGGYVAESECGAGVYEALLYFTS